MEIGRPKSSIRRTYLPPSLFSPNLNHTFRDSHIRRPSSSQPPPAPRPRLALHLSHAPTSPQSSSQTQPPTEINHTFNNPNSWEGCSAVTKSLYTYGLQDRVLYHFCPAFGRLVVATRGEIRVLDFFGAGS